MPYLARALIFRLLIVSTILMNISWIYALATKTIQSPLYFRNPTLSLDVYSPFAFLLLATEVLVRHVATKRSGKYWSNLYELLSLTIETTIALYYTVGITPPTLVDQPDILYVLLISSYVMIMCLVLSLLCLIWDLFSAAERILLKPFQILGKVSSRLLFSTQSLIFGDYLFKKRYKEETATLRITRGIVAGAFLIAFGLITCYALAIQPFSNHGSMPLKEFHASARILESSKLGSFPSWTVIAQSDFLDGNHAQAASLIPDALRVQWLSTLGPIDTQSRTFEQGSQIWNDCSRRDEEPSYLIFDCTAPFMTLPSFFDRSLGFPEVLVTTNFTALPVDFKAGYWQAVRISVGFDASVAEILANSEPIPLLPNVYLTAAISTFFYQRFANTQLAAFGVKKYSALKTFTTVKALIPDPNPKRIENGISSLRLFPLLKDDLDPHYQMILDSTENSVLSGFALLGGLWTFFNGTFSLVFGSTLLLVLFGLKPLSVYGLVHLPQKKASSLAEGQVLSFEEQARIVALLREHLLDVRGAEMKDGTFSPAMFGEFVRPPNDVQTASPFYVPLRQTEGRSRDTQLDVPGQATVQPDSFVGAQFNKGTK